jgi:hypothetical protein
MRALAAIALVLALGGCATLQKTAACPAGQSRLQTAQLFLGRNPGDGPVISEAEFRRFIAEEVSPRFPGGLSVVDGGDRWRGEENRMIREASKVVLIALPSGAHAADRIEAVQSAYRARFQRESVVKITEAGCVVL